jgi:predicted transcriptional regulator
MLYLIKEANTKRYKLGYTGKETAAHRLTGLQTNCSQKLILLLETEGSKADEKLLHQSISEYHTDGGREWFELTDDVLDKLIERMRAINGNTAHVYCPQIAKKVPCKTAPQVRKIAPQVYSNGWTHESEIITVTVGQGVVGPRVLSTLQQTGKKLLTGEIAESVASDYEIVRANLNRLKAKGAIQSEKIGKQRFWWINKILPLEDEEEDETTVHSKIEDALSPDKRLTTQKIASAITGNINIVRVNLHRMKAKNLVANQRAGKISYWWLTANKEVSI